MINKPSVGRAETISASDGTPEEQSRLDQAIRRADDLLVSSLKTEERRRNRRRILWLSLGGLGMLTTLLVLLFAFAGDNKPIPVDLEKSAQLSQDGWNLWKAQQFAQAIDKFQESVKLNPKNIAAWNGLGWSQFNSSQYDKAEPTFKKLLDLEPAHPAALNGLGQLYLIQKKYDKAEKYFLKAAPNAPAAQYGLARLYLLQGKYNDAAKWAKEAIASGDDDGTAKRMLQAAQQKKLPDDLRRQLDPAGTPEVTQAWQLMNQGRRDEAKTLFEAALAKSPDDTSVLNGLGWFYLFGGDNQKAKPYFEKTLKIDPLAGGSMNGMARILKAEGNLDDAMKFWQQMIDKLPGPNAGTSSLADVFMEKGDYKKALPLLEQLVKEKPDDEAPRKKLKQAREEAGKTGDTPPDSTGQETPATSKVKALAVAESTTSSDSSNTDSSDTPAAPTVDVEMAKHWATRLAELKGENWRAAFAVGQQLAQLPPDEGYAILKANWSKIDNFEARQQILKAFDFTLSNSSKTAENSRLVDVLNLGMRDPSPDVQGWAITYLTPIAFQDFGENFSAYKTWYAANRGKKLSQIIMDSVAQLVTAANADENQNQHWTTFFNNNPHLGSIFRDVPQARQGAINAGLPALLERWIATGAQPQASQAEIKLAGEAISMLSCLKLDEQEVRRVVTPLLDPPTPLELRAAAVRALEGKGNLWAAPMILRTLADCATDPKDDIKSQLVVWGAAGTLASMDDPKVIPTMIAVIDADNTYKTVYGVGYFGLGRMTGVQYDEKHDGRWWRTWWENNKERFPAEVQKMEIPKIEKRSM